MHIDELAPDSGERHAIFGGTRSGKSSFQDWSLRSIQERRPEAMQILVDTKPRFRAETERGPFRRGRKNAAHRYSGWAKGPVVPNSVVVDLYDDKPFRSCFSRPGEIAILQSGEAADWKRMLMLLDGFVKANVGGRERRVIVDECLDFTSAIPGVLTLRTMCFIGSLEQGESGISVWIWERTKFTECLPSYSRCFQGSRYFTCVPTRICGIYKISESGTRSHLKVITSSDNTESNLGVLYRVP